MSQLVWLVTGCSSGLGEQFVHSILARGDEIIATGRNIEKLKHLEQAGASVLQLDITDSQQSIRSVIDQATSIHGKVDFFVNNASYISIGLWEDLEYEDYLAQFDTNVFGTIKVTRAISPHFRQRKAGTLVFIGSLSGWIGHPGVSAYAGSKFALEGVVEALHQETAHLGIKTLLIEPGRFRTKLLSSENMKAARSSIPEYQSFSQNLLDGMAKEDRAQPGDPVKLVEIIIDLVRREGIAEGKEVPFRFPLGADCYDDIKTKCEENLKLLEEWKGIIRSTDY
ncbi:NAD(P)-binding protein [Aulographum hederae CBS 113979]|uniref:NAD(P)-binding protein n=1 Tax=Aulographum hederae CBS 113979 TaxID=1176131 RepID=A0A6G1H7E0_9PEZI|nr:NAD(P)-binding protein [Aulographum hederae CBS 113979]